MKGLFEWPFLAVGFIDTNSLLVKMVTGRLWCLFLSHLHHATRWIVLMVEITGQVDSSQTTDPEDEAVLRKIVEDNPELSDFGYGVFYARAPA